MRLGLEPELLLGIRHLATITLESEVQTVTTFPTLETKWVPFDENVT
jgi:hypothetical protein